MDESVTEEDQANVKEGRADLWDLRLQTLFVWVYDWQDKAVGQLDALCRSLARVPDTEEALRNWYSVTPVIGPYYSLVNPQHTNAKCHAFSILSIFGWPKRRLWRISSASHRSASRSRPFLEAHVIHPFRQRWISW